MHVPFEDDGGVFQLRTSSFTTTKPRGKVKGDHLLLTIEYAHDTQPDINARVQGFVNEVERYLGWACDQIALSMQRRTRRSLPREI